MPEERLDTSSGRRPDADDFKSITGIGPTVEKRLNNVSIFTFAQLAALSPADIAAAVTGISGLTTERIIKQDWVGQARRLATHSAGSKTDLSKQEETLLRATIPSHSVIALHVRELKVVERGTTQHRKTLPFQQPFDIQLTFDLSGQTELPCNSLEYNVHIYAKGLEDRTRHMLAEAHGTITLNERITITAQGKSIPQGTYYLWTHVNLLSTGKAIKQSLLSSANTKQTMLLIY